MTIFDVCPISWTSLLGYIIDLKSFLFLAAGTKSRLPSLYLRKQPNLNFQSYFMKNTPFLVLFRIRGNFQSCLSSFSLGLYT